MKKIVSLFLIAASCAASASALNFGASAGYLVDSEDVYFAARGGLTLKATSAVIHSAELEVGYYEDSESGVTLSLMPVTLNYRAEFTNAGKFSPFVGAGAGLARVEAKGFSLKDSDTPFAVQAFAGVSYHATEAVSLNVAARYIWVDDADLFGASGEVGDDVALEVGISFKF